MDRRVFIGTLAGSLLAAPLAAEAQPAGRIPRIAFLSTTSPENSPTTDAFRQGLRELGYVDGRNISIDYRWGRGRTEQFSDFVGMSSSVLLNFKGTHNSRFDMSVRARRNIATKTWSKPPLPEPSPARAGPATSPDWRSAGMPSRTSRASSPRASFREMHAFGELVDAQGERVPDAV
jgi:hypothetical protein